MKNYLRNLKRYHGAPQRTEVLPCVGGPYDSQKLRLTACMGPWDCCTAVIRVHNWVGRYKCQSDTYGKAPHVLVWESAS